MREDLAAAYRLIGHYGMTDLIFTHVTARVPGPEHHILINCSGQFFEEVTATLGDNDSFLAESRDAYRAEVDSIARDTSGVTFDDAQVAQFLSQFRAFNPADLV